MPKITENIPLTGSLFLMNPLTSIRCWVCIKKCLNICIFSIDTVVSVKIISPWPGNLQMLWVRPRKDKKIKNKNRGVLWWLSGLRISCCYCSGSGCSCGMGSAPGLGTYTGVAKKILTEILIIKTLIIQKSRER